MITPVASNSVNELYAVTKSVPSINPSLGVGTDLALASLVVFKVVALQVPIKAPLFYFHIKSNSSFHSKLVEGTHWAMAITKVKIRA